RGRAARRRGGVVGYMGKALGENGSVAAGPCDLWLCCRNRADLATGVGRVRDGAAACEASRGPKPPARGSAPGDSRPPARRGGHFLPPVSSSASSVASYTFRSASTSARLSTDTARAWLSS